MICLNSYVTITNNHADTSTGFLYYFALSEQTRDRQVTGGVTCMFSGGVGQVESTSPVVGPTHELDSDLVAS